MSSADNHANVPGLVVEARDVRVSLQGTEILHGVSLEARQGEVVALMGGNGSGKSTLVRAMVGAVPLTSGSVLINGKPSSPASRALIGYVPQRVTAAGGVSATAREVVESGLLGHRRLAPPRGSAAMVRDALETVSIGDLADKDVSKLSGGQQQRVLIARALVRQPQVLILDEPMAGVDLQSQLALAHALGHLKEHGVAMVIVLHELGALARMIDSSVVLEHGCVTHTGTPLTELGVHALPGHDHEHPHEGPGAPARGGLTLEGPR